MQYISSRFLTNRKQVKSDDFKPQHSRKLFSEVPKDVFQEISDFLGNEETLNKLFPLSKEIFSNILDENFTLKIISMNGKIDKINYYEILKIRSECFENYIKSDKKNLNFSESYYIHKFSALLSNVKKSIQCNLFHDAIYANTNVSLILPLLFANFILDICIDKNFHRTLTIIQEWGLLYFSFCILIFMINELQNFHLIISEEQKESIIEYIQAKKKLSSLQKHIFNINEILKRIEEEKRVPSHDQKLWMKI